MLPGIICIYSATPNQRRGSSSLISHPYKAVQSDDKKIVELAKPSLPAKPRTVYGPSV